MANRKAQEAFEALFEISDLLNTGLDRESLSVLVQLCEMGVNPGALVHVVQELRREGAHVRDAEAAGTSVRTAASLD